MAPQKQLYTKTRRKSGLKTAAAVLRMLKGIMKNFRCSPSVGGFKIEAYSGVVYFRRIGWFHSSPDFRTFYLYHRHMSPYVTSKPDHLVNVQHPLYKATELYIQNNLGMTYTKYTQQFLNTRKTLTSLLYEYMESCNAGTQSG